MKKKTRRPLNHGFAKSLIFILVAVVIGVAWYFVRPEKEPPTNSSAKATHGSPDVAGPDGFDKTKHSIEEASSIWVVVNKGRILPSDYVPANLTTPKIGLIGSANTDNMHLRSEASLALEKMSATASTEGVKLVLVSGYRSYSTQRSVYNGYVSSYGQANSDAYSARPGHSEHQTGLAADVGSASGKCQLEACFGDMAEGKWLAANAGRFGFIIRYQLDKRAQSGYEYEPWHLRFVGEELAAQIPASQTLEQFFSLPAYDDYPATPYRLRP